MSGILMVCLLFVNRIKKHMPEGPSIVILKEEVREFKGAYNNSGIGQF